MAIKIKALRVITLVGMSGKSRRTRAISEPTYRRILALVRACEAIDERFPGVIDEPLAALRAQCEKENAK